MAVLAISSYFHFFVFIKFFLGGARAPPPASYAYEAMTLFPSLDCYLYLSIFTASTARSARAAVTGAIEEAQECTP